MKKSLVLAVKFMVTVVVALGLISVTNATTVSADVIVQKIAQVKTLGGVNVSQAQIGVFEAKELIAQDGSLLIIDVRPPAEFSRGHITGAVNVSPELIEKTIAKIVKKTNTPIVVYCCNKGLRSTKAKNTLRRLGYKDVSKLEGGWDAWTRYDQKFDHESLRKMWERVHEYDQK